jgi:predicted Rossmann-fold nucleotide-binding protein
LTWAQLGLHAKPVGLLNTAGFFGPLLGWVDAAVREGILRPQHRELLAVAEGPEALLELLMRRGTGRRPLKWIDAKDR